jgi:hypothetical protein
MNTKPFYAWEKFGDAVHHLTIDEAEIKSRLFSAFVSISLLSPRDLPDELRGQFEELIGLLTAKDPKKDEGRIGATLHGMRKQKASEIAERFMNIYLRLAQICNED